MQNISTSNLEKALKKLMGFLKLYAEEENLEKKEAFKTSCIQAFEYTYESAIGRIKRYYKFIELDENIRNPEFKDLIRISGERGLIKDVSNWYKYREKRNTTSHTYDEEKADEIFKVIPEFTKDIEFLINFLNKVT